MRSLEAGRLIVIATIMASASNADAARPYVVVLGVAQDAGYPQAGTRAAGAWRPSRRRRVASLGLVDPPTQQRWLFEATPDFPEQLWMLDRLAPAAGRPPALAGIFLTHAHMGHYTGLLHLGREAIDARSVRVFVMPRMKTFLQTNGPWDQLVRLDNVSLRSLTADRPLVLTPKLSVTPFVVPHRDEYSETVGYVVRGPERAVAFLPDIDKWRAWGERRVEDLIARVDVAYLDGTFFADGEIPGRAMKDIPHPFIAESLERFGALPATERAKVRFIHLNRTNPALWPRSAAQRRIRQAGLRVARRGEHTPL